MPTPPGFTAEASLDVFGGMDSEIAPPDCPAGVSPLNQDMAFLPGNCFSREALRRRYTGHAGKTVTYCKTYLQPNGKSLNLVLFSDGTLWAEDVAASPGTLSQIASVTPGSYASSVTALGREYMAFSDGISGTDAPRQFDGTNFDRISQDGPASPPTSAVDFSSTASITSIAPNGVGISGVTSVTSPDGLTAAVTVTTSSAHGFSPGFIVQVVGTSHPRYNGQQTILTVPSTTTFTYQVIFVAIPVQAVGRVSNVAEIASAVQHGLAVGDQAMVAAMPDNGFNGVQTVTGIPSAVQWSYSNPGTNTSPSAGSATFLPVALGAATGGAVYSSATATFATLPQLIAVGDPLQIFDSAAGDSSLPYDSNVGGNPSAWTVIAISGTSVTFSIQGIAGLTGSNGSTTGGDAVAGGLSSTGQYQLVVIFQTRNDGYLTAPSPPRVFNSLGGQKLSITGLPIGPPNVVARIIALTAAGGGNFFYVPTQQRIASQVPGGQEIVIQPTVVADNTTTSVVLNVADNSLLAATGINIPGNNLFAQVVLAPCLSLFAYADRLVAWGERNKTQNLLNMGFDGGYIGALTAPTGWTVETSGGVLESANVDFGFAWQITDDGSGTARGKISQQAAKDYYGVAIAEPLTQYTLRVWLKASPGSVGNFVAELRSATSGLLASASIALSGVSEAGQFYEAEFSAATPATIPDDLLLHLYTQGQGNGLVTTADECELVFTAQPVQPLMRFSYAGNPEAFDGVTGTQGALDDPTPVQCCSEIRGTMYFKTLSGYHATTDSPANEPGDWVVDDVSMSVGALGAFAGDSGKWGAGDSGEEWDMVASRAGLYIFSGGELLKLSQEIQTLWETINWAAQKTIWVKNDLVARRTYIGLPLGTATAPNTVLMLDTRELETAREIADSPPVHISFTGKMIASDLTRKWSQWTIQANRAELMALPGGATGICFAGGNGVTPGGSATQAFGNLYTLGPVNSTDDDYGQISPFYWTYGFVSREQEQTLQVGSWRKIFPFATAYATGVGTLSLTPAVDSLSNTWPAPPALALAGDQGADLIFGLNVLGERCFFKIASAPLANQTDNGFSLQKLVVGMRSDPNVTLPMAG